MNKKVLLIISLILIIAGTFVMIYDWSVGSSAYDGSNLFYISFLAVCIGIFIVIYFFPKRILLSAYPFVLAGVIYSYSYFYVRPKIKNEGITTNAIVVKVRKRMFHYPLCRGIEYEYKINSKLYKFTICNKNYNVGDSISIIYKKNKPNFHLKGEKYSEGVKYE